MGYLVCDFSGGANFGFRGQNRLRGQHQSWTGDWVRLRQLGVDDNPGSALTASAAQKSQPPFTSTKTKQRKKLRSKSNEKRGGRKGANLQGNILIYRRIKRPDSQMQGRGWVPEGLTFELPHGRHYSKPGHGLRAQSTRSTPHVIINARWTIREEKGERNQAGKRGKFLECLSDMGKEDHPKMGQRTTWSSSQPAPLPRSKNLTASLKRSSARQYLKGSHGSQS